VQITPDLVSGLLTDVSAMDLLGSAIANVTNVLGCPALNYINKNQFEMFPGWTRLGSDGIY